MVNPNIVATAEECITPIILLTHFDLQHLIELMSNHKYQDADLHTLRINRLIYPQNFLFLLRACLNFTQ